MNECKSVSTLFKENLDAVTQTVLEYTFGESRCNKLTYEDREALNGIILSNLLRLNNTDIQLLIEHFCIEASKAKPIDCIELVITRAMSHLQKEALPDLIKTMNNIENKAARTE